MIIQDASSLLSMERFCLTKRFHFLKILTMLDQPHFRVKHFYGDNPKNSDVQTENIYRHLGKLTVGKSRGPGYWYQHQGKITNLNVFG